MSVRMVERQTERGNRYYYVEENGKRIAQCRKRADAKRVMDALHMLSQKEEAFNLEQALAADDTAREDARNQMATPTVRKSGIVVAQRLP